MRRALTLLYGGVCYLIFNLVFIYLIAFTGGIVVPKTVDSGPTISPFLAVLIDIGLILMFGLPHSLMARDSYKRWWRKVNPLPTATERSTYVLVSAILLATLFGLWQPLPGVVWHFDNIILQSIGYAVFGLGWALALISTYQIDHAELLGLRQVYNYFRGSESEKPSFQTPVLYRMVRHPLMLGTLVGFWATPHMTFGHLVLALGMTVYSIVGIWFEERALVTQFGEQYKVYQQEVPMLLPLPRPSKIQATAQKST